MKFKEGDLVKYVRLHPYIQRYQDLLVIGKVYKIIAVEYTDTWYIFAENINIRYPNELFTAPTPEDLEHINFPQKLEDLLK